MSTPIENTTLFPESIRIALVDRRIMTVEAFYGHAIHARAETMKFLGVGDDFMDWLTETAKGVMTPGAVRKAEREKIVRPRLLSPREKRAKRARHKPGLEERAAIDRYQKFLLRIRDHVEAARDDFTNDDWESLNILFDRTCAAIDLLARQANKGG